uniref:Uncharacterized protein n=1 Tax=Anguilla anguilla TaxID=7936 RepID=A0A0E9WR05_ANGAN
MLIKHSCPSQCQAPLRITRKYPVWSLVSIVSIILNVCQGLNIDRVIWLGWEFISAYLSCISCFLIFNRS